MKPFIIGDGLQNLIIKKGQVITFDIKYGGEPEPEVKWVKVDEVSIWDTFKYFVIHELKELADSRYVFDDMIDKSLLRSRMKFVHNTLFTIGLALAFRVSNLGLYMNFFLFLYRDTVI